MNVIELTPASKQEVKTVKKLPKVEKPEIRKDYEKELKKDVEEALEKGFDVLFLAEKIITFAELFDDIKLYEYQKEVARHIIKDILLNRGNVFTIEIARQAGKTEILASIVKSLSLLLPRLVDAFPEQLGHFKKGLKTGIFAPQKELSETMYGRILDRLDSEDAKPFLYDASINAELKSRNPIKLTNGSLIKGHSLLAKNLVSFTYDFIIIDEAQAIPDDNFVTENVYPMGSATNATIVLVGVAGDQEGLFSTTIEANRLNQTAEDIYHFEYNYKHVEQYNSKYAKYVRKRLEDVKKGIMSQTSFDRGYLLKWGFNSELFCPRERLTTILDYERDYVHYDKDPYSVIVAGIDLGKKVDSTVVTMMRLENNKYVVLKWLQLDRVPYGEQKYEIYEFVKNYNVCALMIDSTGVGEAIADDIEAHYEMTKIFVERLVYTDKSKSAVCVRLDEAIESKKLVIPSNYSVQQTPEYRRFVMDMTKVHRVYRKSFMLLESQKSKALTQHDDYVDSLSLAVLSMDNEVENEEITDSPANFWLRD